MRCIVGHSIDRRVKLNVEANTIDVDSIFSLICISLYVKYLYYVSCHGPEYKTCNTAELYLD